MARARRRSRNLRQDGDDRIAGNPTHQVVVGFQAHEAVAGRTQGDAAAGERLSVLWPSLRAELGDDALADSQAQYLRYALSVWEQCVGKDTVRDPLRAVRALEVLCVLFTGAID